jgi:hypothetical protein
MLEKPRLLLLRALDPLNPLEPPPNAFRSPAPPRVHHYAIGSARTQTGAARAIRAANASCSVAGTCIPPKVAYTTTRGRPTRELSTLSRNLLPGTGLALGQ